MNALTKSLLSLA